MYIKLRGSIIHVALFFPSLRFFPQGFPSKVFNEATSKSVSNELCTLFPSLGFYPTGFFPSKVLTRHIHQFTSKGEYYEISEIGKNIMWM